MPVLLLVKTSSLGDVIHAMPALTDLQAHDPSWTVHWMVEEALACLPLLHPMTASVVPIAMRRWRRAPASAQTRREVGALRGHLRTLAPDLVLDLQGLLKSAVLAALAPGERHGYDFRSAREPLAALFYSRRHAVARDQHAVTRNRQLTARALGSDASGDCDYGLGRVQGLDPASPRTTALLLHASSRDDKLWPESHWVQLGEQLAARGLHCVLPAGNAAESARAERIASAIPGARALLPGPLANLLPAFAAARLAVGVDTGLTHLATAYGLPTVALFTATDPAATGVFGSPAAVNLGGVHACPEVSDVLVQLERLGGC